MARIFLCYNYFMLKQKPFLFSFLILGILIILHSVGSYYSWYWLYPRFDIIVHVFGGLWVALLALWLTSIFGRVNSFKNYKLKVFFISFISAVVIGLLWELLENLSQTTFVDSSGYYLNTALDILGDGLGGVLAFLYFIRRKKITNTNYDVLHPFYNKTGLINN